MSRKRVGMLALIAAASVLLAGAHVFAQPPGGGPPGGQPPGGGPPSEPPGRARIGRILRDRDIDWRDPQQRAQAAERIREIEIANLERARERADAMGIPMRRVLEDGTEQEIIGLDADGEFLIYTTHNANAAISSGANILHTAPYGLDGSGITVGIWDSGGVRPTHTEFDTGSGSRVTIMDGTSPGNHSTHVGGTVGARGASASHKGMAPNVRIDSYHWSGDISGMTSRAASEPGEDGKIPISNHSYGYVSGWNWTGSNWQWIGAGNDENGVAEAFGQYTWQAADWDSIAYNAPYYLMFKSAGNNNSDNPMDGAQVFLGSSTVSYDPASHPPGDGVYRNGYENIGHGGNAKNNMTVGAVNNAVNSDGERDPSKSTIAHFSSRGPTDDGRIKPDIVANGVELLSTSSSTDTAYTDWSGTSMSTPSAAGSAALLVQLYSDLFDGGAMRASTLKGLIIHTATDLGAYGLGNVGPDYRYGWGLINVEYAADMIVDHHADPSRHLMRENFLSTSVPVRTYEFDWNGFSPIRATLCWTDPAGASTSVHDDRTPTLVNDLDLKLIAPDGTEYLPWVMPFVVSDDPEIQWQVAGMSEPATTGTNHTDTVEQVVIQEPAQVGTWQIQITHKGSLTNDEQYFSLLLSGVADSNPPTPDPMTFAVPPAAGGFRVEPGVLASTDFTGRTVSGATAENIPWTVHWVESPGNLATDPAYNLFDTNDAQDHFAPVRNVDLDGPWSVPIPLSLTVPEITLTDVVLDYQHFNGSGYFQGAPRTVDWTVTVSGSSSGLLASNTVHGVASTSGTETVVFSPALTLTDSESYTMVITAAGTSGGNNTGLSALRINGEKAIISDPETEISMTATTASDSAGVEYYFSEITGGPGGSDSGWQDSPYYVDSGLLPGTEYRYTVVARDKSYYQNMTAPSPVASATTEGTPPYCIVTYDANGATDGDVPVDTDSPYDPGLTVTVLGNTGDLVRVGFTFSGWNTAADGSGESYVEGDAFTISGHIRLYAQWTVNTYNVTFNKQGGTGGTESTEVTFGSPMPAADAPTRTGYTFNGYYTEIGGGGTQYYTADMASARNWDVPADTALYASWTQILSTVHYNGNEHTGGTVPTDTDGPYAYGATVTVLGAGDLVKTGLTFAGWNTAADGSGSSYAPGDTFLIYDDTTLYAQWVDLTKLLPFEEDFETLDLGDLDGQNGWEASGVEVQTNVVKSGLQAAAITDSDGYIRSTFTDAQTNVWTDFHYQPVFFEEPPYEIDPEATAVLYFNTNGHPVVYNGQEPEMIETFTVESGQWVRVTIEHNYTEKVWDLYLNGVLRRSDLAFYNAERTHYEELHVSGAGNAIAYLDDIRILLTSPLGDLIYYTLTVLSAHGDPLPAAGESIYLENTWIEASVSGSPYIEEGVVKYEVTGWEATGSGLTSGTGTNMSFNITEETTLTWQWSTNYWVEFMIEGE